MAVDKYVMPETGFSKVFRSVIIGRATSGFIEEYSNTIIHFYPSDKNKLYKANKFLRNKEGIDYAQVSEELNKTDSDTTPEDIRGLMTAASTVSADSPIKNITNSSDNTQSKTLANFVGIDENLQPDRQVEFDDLTQKLSYAINTLSLFR